MVKEEQKLNLNPVVIADILKKKIIFNRTEEEKMMDFELKRTYLQKEDLHSTESVTCFDEDGNRKCTSTPISDGMPERNSPFELNENNNQVEVVDDLEEDVNENGNLCVKMTDVFSIFKNWFMHWVIAIPLFILQVKTFIFCCSGENKEEQDVQQYDATGDVFELLYNKKDDEDPDNNSLESLESEKTIINGKYYKPVAK